MRIRKSTEQDIERMMEIYAYVREQTVEKINKERYPGITVEVFDCDSPDRATDLLVNNSADCASMQIVSSDKLEIIPLGRQENMLVGATNPL